MNAKQKNAMNDTVNKFNMLYWKQEKVIELEFSLEQLFISLAGLKK